MKQIALDGGFFVIVDDEDYEYLSAYKWHRNRTGYARRTLKHKGKSYVSQMHRLILGMEYGGDLTVDHINGNTLDNRKENLRICTRSENQWNRINSKNNTSGYKGVSFHSATGQWRGRVSAHKVEYSVGYFETKELANEAVCEFRKKIHGCFSCNGSKE